MLKAKTSIQTPRTQRQLVFGKTSNILFFHLVVGFWDDAFLIDILALALRRGSLRTATQHAFPNGISQHQFPCHHLAIIIVEGGNRSVSKFLAKLLLVEMALCSASQQSSIQVDA